MVPHAQMRTVIVALATTGAWAGNASFLPQCTRPFRGDPGRYGIDAGGPEPADTCVAAVGVAKPVAKGIGSTSATPDAQSNHLHHDGWLSMRWTLPGRTSHGEGPAIQELLLRSSNGRRATLGPRATGLGPRPMKRQLRIPAHKWLIGGSPWFL